ncbi:MAG: SHOCT domain-containing protein [Actinomycetota bacterium]|nr:SHOCT domain-containing protein [Actinomycetota bacterium]
MTEDRPNPGDEEKAAATPDWRVDVAATRARLQNEAPEEATRGGRLVYTDEHGRRRRLPADVSELSPQEVMAAAKASSYELGAVEPSYVQIVAIERLNELRAAGAFSEEDYLREKRRILDLG